jgi:hypothetical protein
MKSKQFTCVAVVPPAVIEAAVTGAVVLKLPNYLDLRRYHGIVPPGENEEGMML